MFTLAMIQMQPKPAAQQGTALAERIYQQLTGTFIQP